MKVFDFDNTIYKGESSVDFAFYMIRHNKRIIRYIPTILFSLVGYKLCLLKKEKLESIINDFFAGVLDGETSPEGFVKAFWKINADKLYGDKTIDMFYTDSYNDKDMMAIAREVYIVKHGVLKKKVAQQKQRTDGVLVHCLYAVLLNGRIPH